MYLPEVPHSVLREPSPDAKCTCEHWIYCNHVCHARDCDPSEAACDIVYLADDGGLTPWGCPECTPGVGMPHYLGCELIGWNVPMPDSLAHGLRIRQLD
jgi:hypothetical protein